MHTKDILSQELRKAGLTEMADKAAQGYYHDFLSPMDMPAVELANDLAKAGTPEALLLRERHLDGEFDASAEESEEWINSQEGKTMLSRLTGEVQQER